MSIILPVYRDATGLSSTLDALSEQKGCRFDTEIVVANDGADPRISSVCLRYGVREVLLRPRGGSYRARNLALAASGGARLGFVDAGVIVPPGWCAEGWRALDEADYVGGPISMIEPSTPGAAYAYQVAWAFPVETYLERDHFAPTANLFVRREVFDEVGGFEERVRSGGDLEFGKRVFEARRFRQIFSSAIEVGHSARSLWELFEKQHRVREGQIELGRLYPDRFPRREPSWTRVARSVLPPRRVRWNSPQDRPATLWQDVQAYVVNYLLRLYGGLCDLRWLLRG